MNRTIKPKTDVVLTNGIFLRRGAVRAVEISDDEWKIVAPYVNDLTPTGVDTKSAPAVSVEEPKVGNDIQHKPKKGKKQTV